MNPNSNGENEYVSEDDNESDIWFMKKALELHEMMEQEEMGQTSNSRQPIYREYDEAEERLMRDYFGDHPKYSKWKFRRCYRMSRKLILEIVKACANKDLTILNSSSLFDDLLEDIALVAPFLVYEVQYEKGYYLADGIYPQWSTFVKSLTVAQNKKHGILNNDKKVQEKMLN
ncbi:ALP1-like protein [Tanacetum coccineum]